MEVSHNKQIWRNIIVLNHIIISIFLALFFIYSGAKKFVPKPLSSKQVSNQEFISAIEHERYESPVTYRMALKALKASNYLLFVGAVQILAGILIIIPRTRIIGLVVLLPITVNIFCFHLIMDNRADENYETGGILLLNLLLLGFYYNYFKFLLVHRIKLRSNG